MIKKGDIILGVSILLVGIIVFVLCLPSVRDGVVPNTRKSSKAIITMDGELYGEYAFPARKPKTIEVKKKGDRKEILNTIIIDDEKLYMKDSSCNGHNCVKMNPINSSGQTIVCLPHKLVVEINGGVINADTYTY